MDRKENKTLKCDFQVLVQEKIFMTRITDRNSNGSIDILDDWGRCRYTIQRDENGLIADIGRRLAEYEDEAREDEEV